MLQSLLPAGPEIALAAVVEWALTWLLHSTVALGVAWLLDRRTRYTRSPESRSALWTGAVFACLLSATVQTATGLGPGIDLAASEAEKVVVEFTPAAGEATVGGAGAGEAPPAASTLHRPHEAERLDPVVWVRSLGHDWPFLLGLAWIAGALALLLRSAGDLRALRVMLRQRSRSADRRALGLLDDLRDRAGMERPVRLTSHPRIGGPVALPGREICVPARLLRELDDDELRAVLAHELAHVARRDTLVLLVLEALGRSLFFQPLLALARRRIEEAAEACSDEWVRRLGLGPSLAGGLLAVARRLRSGRGRMPVAGLARSRGLEDRVRRLLAPVPGPERGRSPAARRAAPLAGIAAAALLLAAPSVRVTTPGHASALGPAAGDRVLDVESSTGAGAEARELLAAHAGLPRAALERPHSRALGHRPGGTLLVRIRGAEGRVSVALRPGDDGLRLVGPSGRQRRLGLPAAGGRPWTASVVLPRARPGRYELHLPATVRRLALTVDGRSVATDGRLRGGELPRLIRVP